MHNSILLEHSIELINITPINPLISKCQIKVCYVGDEPNRNKSIITKDVAKQMANSLPGSPIVGYYNAEKQDFEEHNKFIKIANGKITLEDQTRPYGFVDLNAKVWFATYLDDDEVEREYLVTEGYLWTGQYPEAKRIIEKGNNQSMELDDKILNAHWTKDNKGKPQFFIINEAIFSKLCILGEDNEPCFEGASITNPKLEFSFEDGFKQQLFSLMEEIKNILNKGGTSVMNTYAVEIGDTLWGQIYDYLDTNFSSNNEGECGSPYRIEGIYEEDAQKFVILQERSSGKYYQLNFTLEEENGFVVNGEMFEVSQTFVPAAQPQFSLDEVESYEATRYSAAQEPAAADDEDDNGEAGDPAPADPEPVVDGEPEPVPVEDPKATYSLEEIPEYTDLLTRYSELEATYNALKAAHEELQSQNNDLLVFKANIEKEEKKAMIQRFYMLSDEDKKDVIDNIDTYSVDDIEAKLSVICVRNKVNFNLDEDNTNNNAPTVYSFNSGDEDLTVPAWVKALQAVAETM